MFGDLDKALELSQHMYQQDQTTPVPPPAFSQPMNLQNVNSNSASKTENAGSVVIPNIGTGNRDPWPQGELSPENNGDIRLQPLQEHVQLEANVNGKEEADLDDADAPHLPLSPDGRNPQKQNENKAQRNNSSHIRKKRKIGVKSGLIGDNALLSLWRQMFTLFLIYGIATFTFVWYVDTLTQIKNDTVKDYKFGYSRVEYDNTYFEYATYCGKNEDYWCELENRGNGCNAMFTMSFLSWIIGVLCLFIISFCGPNSHHRFKIKTFECFYKEKGKGRSRFGGLFIKQTVILCAIISGCLNLGAVLLWTIDIPDDDVAKSNVFCGDIDCDDNEYDSMLGSTLWVAIFSFVYAFIFWLVFTG